MAKKSNIIDRDKPTPVSAIRLNRGEGGLPRNPRLIKDARFRALCKSVETDPQIMNARPIIVDENGIILGGNMRYRACLELGMKELPAGWVQQHAGWTLEQKRRFIYIDNNNYGEYDLEELKNNNLTAPDLIDLGFDADVIKQIEEEVTHVVENELTKITVKPPPTMYWALVGIPLNRLSEIQDKINDISKIPNVVLETTANE